MKIKIDKLLPNPFQQRKTFDKEKMKELIESIRENGFFGSFVVRPIGKEYEIAYGERRLRACKEVGITEIECEVKNLTDEQMISLSDVENSCREDIPPLVRAEYLKSLQEKMGWTEREISKNTGISKTYVNELLNLPASGQEFREAIENEEITPKAFIEAKKGGDNLIRRAIDQRMTVSEVKSALKHLNGKKDQSPDHNQSISTNSDGTIRAVDSNKELMDSYISIVNKGRVYFDYIYEDRGMLNEEQFQKVQSLIISFSEFINQFKNNKLK